MAFNKYQVIKNAISYELANFIFNYFLLKRDAVKYMYDNNITYDNGMLGTWKDEQIPNTYSHYAEYINKVTYYINTKIDLVVKYLQLFI